MCVEMWNCIYELSTSYAFWKLSLGQWKNVLQAQLNVLKLVCLINLLNEYVYLNNILQLLLCYCLKLFDLWISFVVPHFNILLQRIDSFFKNLRKNLRWSMDVLENIFRYWTFELKMPNISNLVWFNSVYKSLIYFMSRNIFESINMWNLYKITHCNVY